MVTGGGHGKTFADIRDHALIRVLTEGLRRTEVTQMRMSDLPLDLVSQRLVRVVPLKGARAEEEGRVALIAPATARAVVAYLRCCANTTGLGGWTFTAMCLGPPTPAAGRAPAQGQRASRSGRGHQSSRRCPRQPPWRASRRGNTTR
jgi:hypothetical protein